MDALNDINQVFSTVIRSSPLAIIVIDMDRKVRLWNHAAGVIFGWKEEEVLGMPLPAIPAGRQEQSEFAAILGNMQEGKPTLFRRTRRQRKDGAIIDVSMSIAPLQNGAGETIGLVGIFADITEHKQAEDLYKTMANSSYAGVYVVQRGLFQFINKNAAAYAGYTAEELTGTSSSGIVHPDDKDAARENACLMLKGLRSSPYEFRIITKDGQIRWIMETVTPIYYYGERAILGNSMDVTERLQMEEALKQSEEKYRTMLNSIQDGYYEIDLPGNFTFVNPSMSRILGYTEKELTGMNNRHYMDRENAKKVFRAFNEVYNTGVPARHLGWELIRKDGTRAFVGCSVSLRKDSSGNTVGFRGILHDITERRQTEEALRQSEERYRTILENIEDGYYEVNLKGKFLFFNDACEGMFGYTKEEMLRMNYHQMADGEIVKKVFQIFNRVYVTGKPERGAEWEVIRKDGTRGHIEASVSLIRNAAGEPIGFRGIIHDITARKETEQAIAHLAYHDPLTGLPNRILFNDRLSMAVAQSQRKGLKFALLMLDLDGFKDVNDTLGHSVGDRLLRRVGERLIALLRKSDTIARMGGDEFLILLQEISVSDNSFLIARKILKAFQRPFKFDRHELPITTSIGIAIYPDDGSDGETLMKHADAALYRAKKEGRNQYRRYLPLIDADILP